MLMYVKWFLYFIHTTASISERLPWPQNPSTWTRPWFDSWPGIYCVIDYVYVHGTRVTKFPYCGACGLILHLILLEWIIRSELINMREL